jgi:hypothetical protein
MQQEPGRTSTSPESGVSGTKRALERTGSGVSRGAAASDEDDDGGDGAGGRKKLRLSKDQAAVLEECFKTHSTLNPVSPFTLPPSADPSIHPPISIDRSTSHSVG